MLRQLIGHVVQRGLLEYLPATNVIGVASSDQHCTVTDSAGNELLADRVIVCSGAEYRTLFPALFRTSGLTICKLQMMQTVPQPHNTLPHSILSGLAIERYPAFKICPSYSLLQQQAVDEQIRAYGIHLLFKQAADGAVIIGDSHEYSAIEHASVLEESTSSAINAAILRYGRQLLDLPSWEIARMWNGYYLLHPARPVYTAMIDERIHIVTGIAGKGMSSGPGFARRQIDSIL